MFTPVHARYVQTGNIIDPAEIDDVYAVNTKVDANNSVNSQGANTIVVHAIPDTGGAIAHNAVCLLWMYAAWELPTSAEASSSSSSADHSTGDIPPASTLASRSWALIGATAVPNALAGMTGAKSFVFSNVPAGVYKFAIGSGLTGRAVLCDQYRA